MAGGGGGIARRAVRRVTAGVTVNRGSCRAVSTAESAVSEKTSCKLKRRSSATLSCESVFSRTTPETTKAENTSRSMGGNANSSRAQAAALCRTVSGSRKPSCAVVSLT